jgi:nicotinate-nucleotide adenylyltransferase
LPASQFASQFASESAGRLDGSRAGPLPSSALRGPRQPTANEPPGELPALRGHVPADRERLLERRGEASRVTNSTRRPPPVGAFGARVALFGGSFDPVHLGHLYAARAAQRAFELDQIVFAPAALPPHKLGRSLAPAADRVRMLELALEREPSWSVWTTELERDGASYTVDTLRCVRDDLALEPDARLHLILGWDNLRGFERWREVREIVALAQPIVVSRGDADEHVLETVRAELGPELGARLERGLVRVPPSPASSTDVRERLSRGEPCRDLVPPTVLEYIRVRGIYAPRDSTRQT